MAKSLRNSHVCPYLIGLEPSDLKGPLAQFQGLKNNKKDTWRLIKTIYDLIEKPSINEIQLQTIFDRFWPDLEKQFSKIKLAPRDERVIRTERAMLEEILSEVRLIKREMSAKIFSSIYEDDISQEINSIKLHIDPSEVGLEGLRIYNIDENENFQNFLNLLWHEVASKRFDVWTYGKKWILVDDKNKTYPKSGTRDNRKISEIGFTNNQTLRICAM